MRVIDALLLIFWMISVDNSWCLYLDRTDAEILKFILKNLESPLNRPLTVFESLIAYERGLVDALQAELGWSDEGNFGEKSLRIIILETACAARMEDCLQTAEDKFSRWMDYGEFIAPNLREIVYK